MANLIDITNNTLSQNTFCFESLDLDIEKIPVPIENAKFGILNFTAVTSSETDKELEVVFTVDCSGSMSDVCSDGRSKMLHIIHTLKNMITFLHEHVTINVNIIVNAFDNIIHKIVERTKINDDNIDAIIYKINKIHPMNSTNIENALRHSAEEIEILKRTYPTHNISHIFMTDGEATDGSKKVALLKSLVNSDVFNAFIGLGIEHDAGLLNGIGSVGKSSYHFIDKLENAGLIYGEILHFIIYKILTDCEIEVQNGLIYDFKTNTWVSNLKIDDIISESNKTYNIISDNPDDFRCHIKGNIDDLGIIYPSSRIEDMSLEKHKFRQRTLQLMFEVNEYCNTNRERIDSPIPFNINNFFIQPPEVQENDTITNLKIILKKNLSDFMTEMKQYMTDNNMLDDKFMKNLCDDIYICYRSFDTAYGNMYCAARQTSQGSQRQYTVSNTITLDENNYNINFTRHRRNYGLHRIQRDTNHPDNLFLHFPDLNNLPIIQHEISEFSDTPYLTQQATQVMRFVSSNCDEHYKDSDETQTY
jgi:hypothetical protein